jgi:hypothetical protein
LFVRPAQQGLEKRTLGQVSLPTGCNIADCTTALQTAAIVATTVAIFNILTFPPPLSIFRLSETNWRSGKRQLSYSLCLGYFWQHFGHLEYREGLINSYSLSFV